MSSNVIKLPQCTLQVEALSFLDTSFDHTSQMLDTFDEIVDENDDLEQSRLFLFPEKQDCLMIS